MTAWTTPPTTVAIFPSSSNAVIPVTYTSVPGKTYVVLAAKRSAAAEVGEVVDDADNTWARIDYAPKSGAVGRRIEAFICTPATQFTQVEILNPGAQTLAMLIEVTGSSGVVNAHNATFSSATTTPASATITPTESGLLVIAGIMANSNLAAAITAPAGWSYLTVPTEGPQAVYRVTDSPASVGVSWALEVSQGSGQVIFALEPALAGPAPSFYIWTGTTEEPLSLAGVWNGTEVVAVDPDSLTVR